MDYKKIYDNLMESRLLLKEERCKLRKQGEYFEVHHIIPKCMGGEGKTTGYKNLIHPNIVVLTAREHYIAHALLFLIYRTRELMHSFHFFCTIRKVKNYTYKVSSRMYEFLKQERSRLGVSEETRKKLSNAMRGNKNGIGNKMTPEHKEKLRRINKERGYDPAIIEKMRLKNIGNKYSVGRVMSEETKQKISKIKKEGYASGKYKISPENLEQLTWIAKNRVFSEEHRRKIRESKLGKPRDEQTKEKLRKAHTGKKHSPETREKISKSNLGKKMSPEQTAKRLETFKRNRLLELGQKLGHSVQVK
jgi:hypothetical protein